MKVVKGEHPREPGEEITIKPYYPWEVTRSRLTPGSTSPQKTHEYEDASIRVIHSSGMIKGQRASLAIPRDEDPEIGGYWDCDGTRSREFVEMYVAELHVYEYGITVEGFVHLGDLYSNDPEAYKFAYERWDQILRDEDADEA